MIADTASEREPYLRDLVTNLVEQLSEYNSSDMLDGYLNALAHQFNSGLTELGLPTILTNEEDE